MSTKGINDQDEPEELVKFLKFVGADLENSTRDYGSELVKQLQDSVEKVKRDREMGNRYMLVEEMLEREYKQGKLEAEEKAIKMLVKMIKRQGGSQDDAYKLILEAYPERAKGIESLIEKYWE